MILLSVKESGGFSVLKELKSGPGLIGIGDIDRDDGGKFNYTSEENYNYLTHAQTREIKIILFTLNEPSSLSSNFPS